MGNQANEGGALWAEKADQTWEHNDYLGNTAGKGSAVHVKSIALDVSHELFVDNIGSPEILSTTDAASIALSYSLFFNNEGQPTAAGFGSHAVFGDPRFAAPDYADCEGSDLSLGVGSAAIDAGSPAQPDPDGSPADIGAFGPICTAVAERVGDGIDSNCDGYELCFADIDGDGHGEPGAGEL